MTKTTLIEPEVRVLLRKEFKQLLSSKSVVLSSLLVPILMLLVIPNFILVASAGAVHKTNAHATNGPNFGLFADMNDDPRRIVVAILPLFVSLVGIILPMLLTTHLVITERERRTLELLVALPVRVEQVMRAKLLAVVVATSTVMVPLVVIDAVHILARGAGRWIDVAGLPVLVVCVLTFATSAALLVALLAKDLRTANNVAGVVLVPTLFLTMAAVTVLPGGLVRPLVLAAVFLVAGLVVGRIALRVVTFERLLS
jgi:ABC-type Na+ efflux pump permease subunit